MSGQPTYTEDLTGSDAGRSLLIISHFITDAERFDRIYDLIDGEAVLR